MKALEDGWKIASPPQLGQFLGVSPYKVILWIRARQLPASNVATRLSTRPVYRITREDFQKFWESRATAPTVSTPTHIETVLPGSAMGFLGHRTPGLAYSCYVDRRFIQDTKPSLPAIGAN